MKKLLVSLSIIGSMVLAGGAFAADLAPAAPPPPPPPSPFSLFNITGLITPPVIIQFGPTTKYSTINCANWAKLPDGKWKALNPTRFGLGYVQGIVPPPIPIVAGGFIYNNVDLYAQLEAQCASGLVTARY